LDVHAIHFNGVHHLIYRITGVTSPYRKESN
jgi:hypothetical protein